MLKQLPDCKLSIQHSATFYNPKGFPYNHAATQVLKTMIALSLFQEYVGKCIDATKFLHLCAHASCETGSKIIHADYSKLC